MLGSHQNHRIQFETHRILDDLGYPVFEIPLIQSSYYQRATTDPRAPTNRGTRALRLLLALRKAPAAAPAGADVARATGLVAVVAVVALVALVAVVASGHQFC